MCTGEYFNGKKSGVWIEYNSGSSIIKSRGNYADDKKVGKWIFYDYNGNLIQEYNYSTKKLIWSKENNKNYQVLIKGYTVDLNLKIGPSYIGGVSNLANELANNFHSQIKWNKKNKPLNLSVDMSILIQKDGTVGEIKYNNNLSNKGMKDYISQEIKLREGKWLVAEFNEEKVDAYINVRFGVSLKNYKN